MMILLDTRYRCSFCGEPLMRDGGNRHKPGQTYSVFMCINGIPRHLGGCEQFGIRMKVALTYVDVPEA